MNATVPARAPSAHPGRRAGQPAPHVPRVVRPCHGTARLTLTINGQSYAIRPIASDALGSNLRAFRLRKRGATGRDGSPPAALYDVAETLYGPTCDCPDFVFHRDGVDPAGCKHVKALIAVGLLGRPAPAPMSTSAPRRSTVAGVDRVRDEFDDDAERPGSAGVAVCR